MKVDITVVECWGVVGHSVERAGGGDVAPTSNSDEASGNPRVAWPRLLSSGPEGAPEYNSEARLMVRSEFPDGGTHVPLPALRFVIRWWSRELEKRRERGTRGRGLPYKREADQGATTE